jgi:hypothetical protein
LEQTGIVIVDRFPNGTSRYRLSEAGEDLRPIIMGLGNWAQRWMESRLFLQKLEPSLLMWDMRRNVDTSHLPRHRCTIQFLYPELSASQKSWWLVVENGMVDLCNFDPGYELDLLVSSSLKSMTAIWMPFHSYAGSRRPPARRSGRPGFGPNTIQKWLGLSVFAAVPRKAP